jgi:hypothetical protein
LAILSILSRVFIALLSEITNCEMLIADNKPKLSMPGLIFHLPAEISGLTEAALPFSAEPFGVS